MFGQLEVLRLAGNLAAWSGARQQVIATNVANADTPGFRAQDLADFAGEGADGMRATRPDHLHGRPEKGAWRLIDAPDQQSPNGNTVSVEDQMLRAAEVRHKHDMALAVYASAMGILRTSLGRR